MTLSAMFNVVFIWITIHAIWVYVDSVGHSGLARCKERRPALKRCANGRSSRSPRRQGGGDEFEQALDIEGLGLRISWATPVRFGTGIEG